MIPFISHSGKGHAVGIVNRSVVARSWGWRGERQQKGSTREIFFFFFSLYKENLWDIGIVLYSVKGGATGNRAYAITQRMVAKTETVHFTECNFFLTCWPEINTTGPGWSK